MAAGSKSDDERGEYDAYGFPTTRRSEEAVNFLSLQQEFSMFVYVDMMSGGIQDHYKSQKLWIRNSRTRTGSGFGQNLPSAWPLTGDWGKSTAEKSGYEAFRRIFLEQEGQLLSECETRIRAKDASACWVALLGAVGYLPGRGKCHAWHDISCDRQMSGKPQQAVVMELFV